MRLGRGKEARWGKRLRQRLLGREEIVDVGTAGELLAVG
jgi:hypothetical protein